MLARVALLVSTLTVASVANAQTAKVAAPEVRDPAGLFLERYAKFGEDLYVAGQPSERGIREMKAEGVTVVVNLRPQSEMDSGVKFNEKTLVESLGMKYVHLPVSGESDAPFSPAVLAKFAAAVKDANGKVLLHCTIGWRASHLFAAYLIKEKGIEENTALTYARSIYLMDEHDMTGTGRQPVEDFLGRKLAGIKSR